MDTEISSAATATQTALDLKVDKVSGKGLSTEDYTTAEKSKLAGLASGAEVNVNADWDATSGDAEILNKPTTLSGYGITDAESAANKSTDGTFTDNSDTKYPSQKAVKLMWTAKLQR